MTYVFQIQLDILLIVIGVREKVQERFVANYKEDIVKDYAISVS